MKQLLQGSEKTGRTTVLALPLPAQKMIFIPVALLCITPLVSPPVALLLGIAIAQFTGHPYLHYNHKATHTLLQVSVVGLGFGMNAVSAFRAGSEGILLTVVSITGTLLLGAVIASILKIERKTAYLISAGTAICGGSAIAAIAPVIRAEEKQISVALGTVFMLNAIALFIFPVIGHTLHLSDTQFGLWCAIAIHDTSSVTGAAARFGSHALEVATTVKLARALWIIPVSLLSGYFFKTTKGSVKVPWFIGLFVIAMLMNTYVPGIEKISSYIVAVAHAGLTLTLFLIGCGLSRVALLAVGWRPLLQGIVLWIVISMAALGAICQFRV
ncbi:MAG: putative sulfate exporter family transporter [Chitinophagaceae bacterium]